MFLKLQLRTLLATAALSSALLTGGAVQAQETEKELVWSYATASVGNCTAAQGKGCGPRRVVRQETFYGPNDGHGASVRPGDYKPPAAVQHFGSAFAQAEAGDDPLGLPSLHASADSRIVPGFPGSGLAYVGINFATAIGVQGFTNTTGGQIAIPLSSIEGEIHYIMGGPNNLSGSVGASLAFSTDAILDPSVALEWFTPSTTLGGFSAGCGTTGALAFGQTGAITHSGPVESRYSVGVSGCGGATEIVLNQGESFYIWARLSVAKAGFGFVDAGNTFNIQFTQEARAAGLDQVLATQLAVADAALAIDVPEPQGMTGAVPEPATWAMLILGFGAAGSAMRRRRAAAPA